VCLVLATGVAHADPVNLLTHRTATVNVGSAVANRSIKPEHLVDGKLDTAWNSRTGDLVGAWIVVRLPADVKVQSVKLTVGFTKVDPKLGDLFVQNPRIKRVRVTHASTVVEQDLDITKRELQDIPIAGDGGDYRIEVLAVEMGSKKTWREICISELEVWGTSTKPMVNVAPNVYVNSFTPPPLLAEDDCTRLFTPANVSTSVHVLSDRYAVCEMVDTVNPHDRFDLMRHTFTLVALPRMQALGQPIEIDSQVNEGLCCGQATDTRLRVDTLVVGDDSLLVAALASSTWSNLPGADPAALPRPSTKFTLYRGTPAGLTQVLEVESTEDCAFTEGALPAGKGKPRPVLDYTCATTTKHFRFDGTRYVQR
jgi:hypothetical protein